MTSTYLKSDPTDNESFDPEAYTKPSSQTAVNHKKFMPDFVNTSADMVSIAQRLLLVGEFKGANFLFHGPSGTGKTEFGRYIAKLLNKPLMVVHTGDILFSRLGVSERVINKFFKEASKAGQVLIFDEADSFLYDRRQVDRQWERQLINEFLRHIEEHDQPLICTTNLLEELDPAMLRRFMFKVEFKPLEGEQAKRAFKHYFKVEAPDYMGKLGNLTLGDFGIVQKKAAVLGYLHDVPALCQLFYEEALARHTASEAKAKARASKKNAA